MFDKAPRHRTYLLTFWEERSQDPDAPVVWRFSLKDPHTGLRRGFASLAAMVAFLRKELDRNEEAGADENTTPRV